MIANRLEDELQEAIQRFADRNWNGALEMEEITHALARLTGRYLAEIPQPAERIRLFTRFLKQATHSAEINAKLIGPERLDA